MAVPVVIIKMSAQQFFSTRMRFGITYSHTDRLKILEPYIASVATGLARGVPLSEQIQTSAEIYPDAAAYFTIDSKTAEESFALKDEFTYDDWLLSSLIISLANRSYSISLKEYSSDSLTRLHSFMTVMSGASAGGSHNLDGETQRGLLSAFAKLEMLLPKLHRPFRIATARHPAVYRLQHACLLYRSATTGVLVDPHLQSLYSPVKGEDIVRADLNGKVDAIIISHAHFDHLWLSTLLMFSKDTLIIVPKVPRSTMICMDMKKVLDDLGFTRVFAYEWFSGPIHVGDMEIWVMPFFGEQPLRYEPTRNPRIRNWGNTYIIKCDGYSSWFLIDSGADYMGSMVEVAESVREKHGQIDLVLSNLRDFCLSSPTYINGGLNWLALTPHQMKRFDSMKSHCITLGTSNVASICKAVSARYYLPYAHWWGELGRRANSSIDTPGQNEEDLVRRLKDDLLRIRCSTRVVDWKIGDGFDGSDEDSVMSLA